MGVWVCCVFTCSCYVCTIFTHSLCVVVAVSVLVPTCKRCTYLRCTNFLACVCVRARACVLACVHMLQLPSEYPDIPPRVYYHSHGDRLNPNLYENGTYAHHCTPQTYVTCVTTFMKMVRMQTTVSTMAWMGLRMNMSGYECTRSEILCPIYRSKMHAHKCRGIV